MDTEIKGIVVDKFLRYIKINTQSSENSGTFPSTSGQIELARLLKSELEAIGLAEIELDDNGYLFATLPSNVDAETPTIGFIAHLDTSPDVSGENVKPSVVLFDGNDIVLNKEQNIFLSPTDFPEMMKYVCQDLIVTDGTTLLGADDKAGVAEIISAVEYLTKHPEIKHGKIRIGFTPDEEIGCGADRFDVVRFGADWAYTVDGGAIGELEFENFNAASASITFEGRNIHPGYAKDKMINASAMAAMFATNFLPANETPEHTEKYEGFYHLISIEGGVEKAVLKYIIRDHDRKLFENRKSYIKMVANAFSLMHHDLKVSVEVKDQYYNMIEKIKPVSHIITLAENAMRDRGVTPVIKPIRGGTDGARLSFEGLPCPNLFAGGHNFHGRYEFLPIPSMVAATNVIINIAKVK